METFAVGSLDALGALLRDGRLELPDLADVVIVSTAAAYVGVADAVSRTTAVFDDVNMRVETVMVIDRAATNDRTIVEQIVNADVVVLCDGSALHARAVWKSNDFGAAINAASTLVAIGEVASVLGDVMIDPRGGAPTNGLGFRHGAALCVPASEEQMTRTRSLLGDETLIVVPANGLLHHDGDRWRVLAGDVLVTRGHDVVAL